jgi:hypothetical protein
VHEAGFVVRMGAHALRLQLGAVTVAADVISGRFDGRQGKSRSGGWGQNSYARSGKRGKHDSHDRYQLERQQFQQCWQSSAWSG